MNTIDLGSLTLEDLDGETRPEPPAGASRERHAAHALRQTPIRALGAEELFVLLRQRESLGSVAPWALTLLEQDPLAAGDFLPGGLLLALTGIPAEFWYGNPHSTARLRAIVETLSAQPDLGTFLPADHKIWQHLDTLRTAEVL
ncbi:contact-dependent growth inhibition system immunity protein [Nocardia sp. alder85J]|uniref:contact-dependent growth inhibition system immunity protein n=1 Tax=Nocardia sp. alder85J TaxID=2862949 RepID=UPI001CD65DB9|nr:contact-dependent growth inhibition system immunity protein [Nocardia sp. alder85J]MCX4098069.1 contact-dependent growth inhibition system immunity protein [Nocardia sp. alder85J]